MPTLQAPILRQLKTNVKLPPRAQWKLPEPRASGTKIFDKTGGYLIYSGIEHPRVPVDPITGATFDAFNELTSGERYVP